MENIIYLIYVLLLICFYIQIFLGYGTAYRYTKRGGDTGIALCGWLILFTLAALIPGLGIYFWNRSLKPSFAKKDTTDTPPAEINSL